MTLTLFNRSCSKAYCSTVKIALSLWSWLFHRIWIMSWLLVLLDEPLRIELYCFFIWLSNNRKAKVRGLRWFEIVFKIIVVTKASSQALMLTMSPVSGHWTCFQIGTLSTGVINAIDFSLRSHVLPPLAASIPLLRHWCCHFLVEPEFPSGPLIEPGLNDGILDQLVWVYFCERWLLKGVITCVDWVISFTSKSRPWLQSGQRSIIINLRQSMRLLPPLLLANRLPVWDFK